MTAQTCKCRRGKASALDGKCGHCRSRREQREVDRMRQGWPRAAAVRGYWTADEKLLASFEDLTVTEPRA